jgi:hypothetical protein
MSLKKIEKARSERRKPVHAGLFTRAAIVERFLAIHQPEETPNVPPTARALKEVAEQP